MKRGGDSRGTHVWRGVWRLEEGGEKTNSARPRHKHFDVRIKYQTKPRGPPSDSDHVLAVMNECALRIPLPWNPHRRSQRQLSER